MTDAKLNLDDVRRKVDLIDFRIIKLLNERMEYVMRIRRMKEGITDQKREQIVMGNIRKHSQGLVRPGFSAKLFDEIINESKRIQQAGLKSIGFQGEHGAYGEVAALKFDTTAVSLPCREFTDVFDEVGADQIDFGIVPVENSLEGAVTEVNDLLVGTDLKIAAEIKLPIHHSLLALPETDYREIKAVYSHPQALAQCRGFLSRNNLEPVPFYDTAGAARMISESRPNAAAAIASKHCAELYNLEIIKDEIEDDKSNFTRFLVLSNKPSDRTGNKCSIVFSTRHQAGTLFAVLKIFAEAGINLTRIESRPIRTDPGKYAFFLDCQGSDRNPKVAKAMAEAEQASAMFKFLGCYREATQ